MRSSGHSPIVANSIATYTRSVMGMVLVLFSSRWVLNALGENDFGLFSLVGSIIIIISFVNGIMAESTSRFYAYSIGANLPEDVRKWFNSALCLHTCLAILIVAIGWPLGDYFIKHYLTIQEQRLDAALWVFRISLFSAFANMVSAPFLGMFTAKQRIVETALFGIAQSFLTFGWAYLFKDIHGDRLIIYALGMCAIIVSIQICLILRAHAEFSECTALLSEWFDFKKIGKIASFGIFKLYGSVGSIARDQGTAVLLNLHFGTGINASYGISMQVSSAANLLSGAMVGAFSPEINTTEGRGDRGRMLMLAQEVNKFGTILTLLFAIPLYIEMDNVLRIWLANPPQMAAGFCRFIIVAFLCERLSVGYILAVWAHGKIAAYQLTLGTIVMLALPLVWLALKLGCSAPASIGIAFISTMALCSVGRAVWAGILLKIPMREWLTETILPITFMTTVSACAGYVVHFSMHESFARLVCVTAVTLVASALMYWLAISNELERNYAKSLMARIHK